MIPVCEQCGQPINVECEEWTISEDNEPIHIDCIELRTGGGQVNEFRQHLKKYDEYEAKAKAYDHIENLVKTELTSDDLYNDARNNDYAAGMLRVYEMVDYIIEEYESGEPNEL